MTLAVMRHRNPGRSSSADKLPAVCVVGKDSNGGTVPFDFLVLLETQAAPDPGKSVLTRREESCTISTAVITTSDYLGKD